MISPSLLLTTWMLAQVEQVERTSFVPMRDPLPVSLPTWVLLVPLALAIAVVYKAIKLDDLSTLPRQAAYLALQIVLFMVAAGVVLYVVTELV